MILPFSNDQNPSNGGFQLSSPMFMNYDGLNELLATHFIAETPPPPPDPRLPEKINAAVARRRRRAARKDRHCKIVTAKGERDRRMRLSLDVARRFFKLQDLLGFDKPSKTISWLLGKSKSAIEELPSVFHISCSPKSESSTLESEEVLPTNRIASAHHHDEEKPQQQRSKHANSHQRRFPLSPALAKETRAKARERAKERTREKKKFYLLDVQKSVSFDIKTSTSLMENVVAEVEKIPSLSLPFDHTRIYEELHGSLLMANSSARNQLGYPQHAAAASLFPANWGISGLLDSVEERRLVLDGGEADARTKMVWEAYISGGGSAII